MTYALSLIEEATGKYSKKCVPEDSTAVVEGVPGKEEIKAKTEQLLASHVEEREAGTYTIRHLIEALNEHFACDLREHGLKPFIKTLLPR